LSLKDDSGEVISKKVLDWVTGIITLAAALSTVIGVFFSDDKKAQQFAYIAAFVLIAISGAIFIYQRRRAARLKIAESLEPLSASAALRGLLPFEEGDQLPGRARDVQELYTLVASSAFRFGVLWGESGCGKTSLLRAGLLPKLRNEKFLPLYIGKPTNNPQEAIRSALLREASGSEEQASKGLDQLLKSAAPKGKKIVILFDQFEEFFLTNRTPKSRAGFIKLLGETIADENVPVVFLIGIRADFFAQLQNFAPQIPEPTSARSTYQLQNFDTEQAKQIFSAAAKADGIPFEPALIQAVIKELETEEFIRPAELQVVGTRLKRKNIFTLNKYEALGGVRGILSSYIGDEIKQSMNQQAARLILRLMCADVVETKSQTDLALDDILRGISGTNQTTSSNVVSRPEEIQVILNQFVSARVLIHTDDDKYNLVHDYLAPYVRTATEGTETNTERANRMLKRYVAEYKEDPKTRIPFGRVRWIKKYASADVKSGEKALELMKTSRRGHYGLVAGLATPIIIILALYFFYLAQSYYLSIDKSYIVLRAGLPQFTFLPGFGDVVIQTEFMREDLVANQADQIDQETVKGFWFERAEDGYQKWGNDLITNLEVISQASALLRTGQIQRAEAMLIHTINDSEASTETRAKAAISLVPLARRNPQIVTSEMIKTLIGIYDYPEDFDYLWNEVAGDALLRLSQASPQAVTSEMLQSLIEQALQDAQAGSHSNKTNLLSELVAVNPQALTPQIVHAILALISNPQIDIYLRGNIISSLNSVLEANSSSQADEVTKILIKILTDPTEDSYVRDSAASGLSSILKANSEVVTPEEVNTLIDYLLENLADNIYTKVTALELIAQAKPEAFTPESIGKLVKIAFDPTTDSWLRDSAVSALSSIDQSNSEAITSESVEMLVKVATDPTETSDARDSAALALGSMVKVDSEIVTSESIDTLIDYLLENFADNTYAKVIVLESVAQAKPEAITSERVGKLIKIAIDPTEEPDVRNSAALALGSISQFIPEEIMSETIQSLLTLLEANTDRVGRESAAHALFNITLEAPEQEKIIRVKLEKLIKHPQPHVRISASRTLEMIDIGDLLKEASSHPEQIPDITLVLSIYSPAYLSSGGEYILDDNLWFAASAVQAEINKIEQNK